MDAVLEVLRSDFLTQGPLVPAFEDAVAVYCGAKHAVAANSATSALHIACLALGLGKGDIAWTSPITFVASANCVQYCGAMIDFVDIDPNTYNMSVDYLAEKLVDAEKAGILPKVVIPVHLCGQPCEMAQIHSLSLQYGFKIIEDASHALGGRYKGKPIGNGLYSDITVFSFHPVKIITTGEGGIAVTNNASLAEKMSMLRSHGITYDNASMQQQEPEEIWNYQQIDLGFNYRMSDIHAALGLSQMQRLDTFVAQRHTIASKYNLMLSGLPVVIPFQHRNGYSSFHLYVICLKLNAINKTHRQVFETLHLAGIGINVHYIPVHMQPYYQKFGFKRGDFPVAEDYFSKAISLPIFPDLTYKQQDIVIGTLNRIFD